MPYLRRKIPTNMLEYAITTQDTRRQVSHLMLSHDGSYLELQTYSSVGCYLFASLVFECLVQISIFLLRLRMVSVHFNEVKDFLIFQTRPPAREALQSSRTKIGFSGWYIHLQFR